MPIMEERYLYDRGEFPESLPKSDSVKEWIFQDFAQCSVGTAIGFYISSRGLSCILNKSAGKAGYVLIQGVFF